MSTKKTWTVTVRREGRLWYLEIPEIDGATQARALSEVEDMARDYIAGFLDCSEDSFDIAVTIELPEDVAAHLARATALRDQEAQARTEAAEESRAAARALRSNGLTIREVGTALGVSHQRAQQLISAG